MTEQRIRRLRRILTDSRSRLMVTYPFFAMMLMYLRYVADKRVRRMTTNGICVYFNPDFLDRLRWDEVDFLLCHQIMHLVNGDIWRAHGAYPETFHYACDILVNQALFAMRIGEKRFPHIGEPSAHVHYGSAKGDSDTPEAIVSRLLFRIEAFEPRAQSTFLCDSTEYWDQPEDVGLGGILILDFAAEHWLSEIPEEERSDDGEIHDKGVAAAKQRRGDNRNLWQVRAMKVQKAMPKPVGKRPGYGTEAMERLLRTAKPRLDWKKLLQHFLQEETKDYTFTPPDRRIEGDFFLPDFHVQEGERKTILFMVDTSGSLTLQMLSEAYAEMLGAVEQAEGALVGKVGFFDTCVHKVEDFTTVEELCRIRPVGGGGTDFFSVFECLEEQLAVCRPSCLVILTDGYAEYPAAEAACGVPVLWILNNERAQPPFGRVIRILEKQIEEEGTF